MVDTSFMDDVVFPTAVSRGSTGGPDWPADIVSLASGGEERNSAYSRARRNYDVSYGIRTQNEAYEVLQLYYAAMGRLRGFRYLDWTDYRSCAPATSPTATDQALGTGDGATTAFQLSKRYSFSGHSFDRPIAKPYGAILVARDGTPLGSGFSVDLSTGIVAFTAAPALGAVLTWGGQFHVPVRFDGALSEIDLQGPTENIPSILLKELLL